LNYILALFLVIILSASAVAQTPYEQYMAQGKAGIASQDYLVAEKAFRAALQEKPDDPEATQYLAIIPKRRTILRIRSPLPPARTTHATRPSTSANSARKNRSPSGSMRPSEGSTTPTSSSDRGMRLCPRGFRKSLTGAR